MKIQRSKQPVIIGVTGHYCDEFRLKAIESGMDEIHSKPFYKKAV